jgi:hypothetical protein
MLDWCSWFDTAVNLCVCVCVWRGGLLGNAYSHAVMEERKRKKKRNSFQQRKQCTTPLFLPYMHHPFC